MNGKEESTDYVSTGTTQVRQDVWLGAGSRHVKTWPNFEHIFNQAFTWLGKN